MSHMSRFAPILLLLTIGCANTRLVQHIKDPGGPLSVEEALHDAAKFWSTQDVDLLIGDEGLEVRVADIPNETYLGECSKTAITVDPSIASWHILQCVMRHETGHALGLGHVSKGENLMSPMLFLPEKDCYFSEEDKAELEATVRGEHDDDEPPDERTQA